MLRKSAQVFACVALLGAAPVGAASDSYSVGISWGTVAYSSGDVEWRDSNTRRLQLGYDFGATPVFFEFSLQESVPSLYDPCPPTGGCAGVTFFQDFSARQLAAGYRVWTHRNSGSALLVKAGFYDAEISNGTGPGPSSREFSDNGFFLGVAGTWMMTPAIGVRADWEFLDGLDAVGRHDAQAAMAGVIVKFGGYPQ